METNLNFLSTRNGFNISLRLFKIINSFISDFSQRRNLADIMNDAMNNNLLDKNHIRVIINALLVDKYKYYPKSFNLRSVYNGPMGNLSKAISKWNIFDIVIIYYHPQLGTVLINPKNEESWKAITGELKRNELVVIYMGYFNQEYEREKAMKASNVLAYFMQGGEIKDYEIFHNSAYESPMYSLKEPEKKPQVTDQPQGIPVKNKLSGKVGVVVTNEVFHNGNVEAWKKIIESYEVKYPDTRVLVFYDNEQINDINTLFKWGKVKSGSLIYISLYGPEFRFLPKLKKYLYQGASHNFQAFLKGRPGNVLNLF